MRTIHYALNYVRVSKYVLVTFEGSIRINNTKKETKKKKKKKKEQKEKKKKKSKRTNW
jgi:hypothetical protein